MSPSFRLFVSYSFRRPRYRICSYSSIEFDAKFKIYVNCGIKNVRWAINEKLQMLLRQS